MCAGRRGKLELHILTEFDGESTRVVGLYRSDREAKAAAVERFGVANPWRGPAAETLTPFDPDYGFLPSTVWQKLETTTGHGQWCLVGPRILELFPMEVAGAE